MFKGCRKLVAICSLMAIMMVGMATVSASAQTQDYTYQVKEDTLQNDYVQGKYPEVIEAMNDTAKDKINSEIQKVVTDFSQRIKDRNDHGEQVTGFVSYDVKNDTDNMLAVDTVDGGHIKYNVEMNEKGVFSVLLNCSEMLKEAAHPNTYTYGLNFDKDGNLITLQQVIESNENLYTVENLQKSIIAQVHDKLLDPSNIDKDIIEFPHQFYLDKDDNLHVLFQRYEIAPYAAGLIDIVINKPMS